MLSQSIYVAFAVSVLRAALLVGGGWLVSRGVVEDGLMREVAAGIAVIVVTQAVEFWRLHRVQLYQRWLVAIGLDSPANSDPDEVDAAARRAASKGLPL